MNQKKDVIKQQEGNEPYKQQQVASTYAKCEMEKVERFKSKLGCKFCMHLYKWFHWE